MDKGTTKEEKAVMLMAHFKFNIDLWVEGETEEEAEKRMESLFDFEPLGEVELIGWECVSKDMTEGQ